MVRWYDKPVNELRWDYLCTKEATGQCAMCDVLAERDQFIRRWVKGGWFMEGLRGLRRILSSRVWAPLGTCCTVIATLVIALATVINMRTAEKQWSVMDRQLGVMAYDQRPWLGVTELTPKQEPRPSIANPSLNNLVHRVTYLIKLLV